MPRLKSEPTAIAEWHTLVQSAGADCGTRLDEPLEAYLVFMLMRFSTRTHLGRRAMALDYLAAVQQPGGRPEHLRDTGDECLIVCGLFPQRARRKRVPFSYFVDLGRGAYGTLADRGAASEVEPFDALAARFITLMEILQAMRPVDHAQSLSPLDAAELAEQTGSRRAWERLSPTDATLAPAESKHRRH
ncbi:MAG: hypothetical protein WD382_11315 [Halofilum sp. (in: g-proteobacteria)]